MENTVAGKRIKTTVLFKTLADWQVWSAPLLAGIAMWYISTINFLLFHTLAEFFAVFVAIILAVVSWHTYSFSKNHFLMYLGCGYAWIGVLDLAHTLTYKGIGVIPGESANTSTQFWIITRYLEALLIVSSPFFLTRKINRVNTILVMGILACLAILLISTEVLPAAYVTGSGLTTFKVVSEYIIIFILLIAIVLLRHYRYMLDPRVALLIVLSVIFTISAELCFTLYISVYGFFNFLGHIFKIFSYWLIFHAVVRTTLTEPYQIMARGSSTYDAIPDPTIVVDKHGIIHQANHAADPIANNPDKSVTNKHCHDFFHPRDTKRSECVICEHIQNGRPLDNFEAYDAYSSEWHEYTLTPVNVAGGFTGMVHVAVDITDRKRTEEALLKQTNYDPLTQLPNRTLAADRLAQAIKLSDHTNKKTGVMFIDLDNFKVINDTLGHTFGDRILIAVAKRLTECIHETDTLAHWSGDEFLVILPELDSVIEAEPIAQKLLQAVATPIRLDNNEFSVSVSIGITCYPDDAVDYDSLLSHADAAMHKAKEIGKNTYKFFTSEINRKASQRLEMEAYLRNAISNNELFVVYQPQININDNTVIGAEALLRWHNSELGYVSPGEFIPLAEETGRIEQIGRWTLESVCKDIINLNEHGYTDLRLSINISSREFQSPDFIDNLTALLAKYDIDARMIVLEVTETMLLSEVDDNIHKLTQLKNIGLSLSLDDFGTGYSSLSYLKKFPFDEIKIDQSFVRDIASDQDDASLCQAIIAMADSLGLSVVGEGVETEQQMQILHKLGASQVQGYYFSKPLTLNDLQRFLKSFPAKS